MIKNTCGILRNFTVSIWLLSMLACAQTNSTGGQISSSVNNGCHTMTTTTCADPSFDYNTLETMARSYHIEGDTVYPTTTTLNKAISTCNLSAQIGAEITSNAQCGGRGYISGTLVTAITDPCWCESGIIGCEITVSQLNPYDCGAMPACMDASWLISQCSQ